MRVIDQQPTISMVDQGLAEASANRLLEIFKGNGHALDVVLMIVQISHVWDDIVDDGETSVGDVNMAFWNCLIGLNSNPFFYQHSQRLIATMRIGILNWTAANELERHAGRPREIAHVCRYSAGDIAIDIADIIGGYAWAARHAAEIKLMMAPEDFSVFDNEMRAKYESDA